MTLPNTEPSFLRLSTTRWPDRDRFEWAYSTYTRTTVDDFASVDDLPLRGEAKLLSMPGLGIASTSFSSVKMRCRPLDLVSDDIILTVVLAGGRTLRQCGREVEVGPGEAVVMAPGEASATNMSDSRYVSFRVPTTAMKPLVRNISDCIARPIRKDTDALRLLLGYGRALHDEEALATPELRRLAATHVQELMALVLARGDCDAARLTDLSGGRAACLRQLQADILANLHADLSIGAVASRRRLGVRYVQRLFEADGTTFAEFVQQERLRRAYRLLAGPRAADRSVAAVALEVGFNDPSYFGRVFRRCFGRSPSDVRAEAAQARAGTS
jgi:AraC-like DNA-binding protein